MVSNMPFLDSRTLGDPLIAGVQELRKIVIGDDLPGDVGTESDNSACH